jgi:hypothetical protein
MQIIIPDDYQDAVRGLACFSKLAGHDVTVFNDTVRDLDALADRFEPADALVLIRERKCTPHLGYVEKDSYELYFGQAFDQVVAFAEGHGATESLPG